MSNNPEAPRCEQAGQSHCLLRQLLYNDPTYCYAAFAFSQSLQTDGLANPKDLIGSNFGEEGHECPLSMDNRGRFWTNDMFERRVRGASAGCLEQKKLQVTIEAERARMQALGQLIPNSRRVFPTLPTEKS